MMKKSELIEALGQGCYIYMDDQSRRAIVYSNTDERLDSCRYDTAENLARLGGYDVVDLGAWSFARRIECTEVRQAAREAAARELSSIRTPGKIEIQAKNDCWIGNNRVTKGRHYIITVYGDGTQEQPGNAYGSLYDFRTHEHAIYFEILSRPEAAQDADAQSARVESATREALARAGMLAQETTNSTEEEKTMRTRKHYLNHCTGEDTASATQAMKWYRAGDLVQVNTYYNEPGKKTGLANVVHLQKEEAPRQERNAEKENRDHCRRIAEEVEAYAAGLVNRCPECDEILHLPDDVGDKYRCPHCGEVSDLDDLEQLGIWDYMADCLDVEYRCGSDREYRSVQIMVACGGPNIYLDTESKAVELYWWNESARYHLSCDAVDALDEWAEEYWNM